VNDYRLMGATQAEVQSTRGIGSPRLLNLGKFPLFVLREKYDWSAPEGDLARWKHRRTRISHAKYDYLRIEDNCFGCEAISKYSQGETRGHNFPTQY
jgi:hypothetical protein